MTMEKSKLISTAVIRSAMFCGKRCHAGESGPAMINRQEMMRVIASEAMKITIVFLNDFIGLSRIAFLLFVKIYQQ